MTDSYSGLSVFYDELTKNVDYNRYVALITRCFEENGVQGIVLDAGCGTGTLSLKLSEKGYDMVGVDSSADMLMIASEKLSDFPGTILLNQEIQKLDLYGSIKGAIATLDVINHLSTADEVSRVFGKIALFMEQGGVFIFDINTPYKHSEILAENAFVFEIKEGMCVWQNFYEKKHQRVEIKLDIFRDIGKSQYLRKSDVFFEHTYDCATIETLLGNNGFRIIDKLDGESFGEITPTTQRIIYITGRV